MAQRKGRTLAVLPCTSSWRAARRATPIWRSGGRAGGPPARFEWRCQIGSNLILQRSAAGTNRTRDEIVFNVDELARQLARIAADNFA